jgi:NADP-dependent 3-hydroxy acid dehydrogenase YdfG
MTTTDNSWVLITGASSGFGAEFARQYATQGHAPRVTGRTHQRCAGLGQQGRSDFCVGDASMAAPSHVVARHERMSPHRRI